MKNWTYFIAVCCKFIALDEIVMIKFIALDEIVMIL